MHHALCRVDCTNIDLPVAPAISDALTIAQKLLGGTASQAGEKCNQDTKIGTLLMALADA